MSLIITYNINTELIIEVFGYVVKKNNNLFWSR